MSARHAAVFVFICSRADSQDAPLSSAAAPRFGPSSVERDGPR